MLKNNIELFDLDNEVILCINEKDDFKYINEEIINKINDFKLIQKEYIDSDQKYFPEFLTTDKIKKIDDYKKDLKNNFYSNEAFNNFKSNVYRHYKSMTTDEFLSLYYGYKSRLFQYDMSRYKTRLFESPVSHRDNQGYFDDPDFEFNVKRYFKLYGDIYEEFTQIAQNIIKGHNTEYDIIYQLNTELKSDELQIYINVFIDQYENDVIIVSEKGVFTLEIKNHIANMHWENGTFREKLRGIVIDDNSKDPYKQTINHEKTLNKLLDLNIATGYVIVANNNTDLYIDDTNIKNRVYYVDEFIKMYNQLPAIIDQQQIKYINKAIMSKRIYRQQRFKFYDMKAIDNEYFILINRFKFYDEYRDIGSKKDYDELNEINQQLIYKKIYEKNLEKIKKIRDGEMVFELKKRNKDIISWFIISLIVLLIYFIMFKILTSVFSFQTNISILISTVLCLFTFYKIGMFASINEYFYSKKKNKELTKFIKNKVNLMLTNIKE